MKYIFPNLNNGLEITDPVIEIVGLNEGNPNIHKPNFIDKTFSIDIHLITDNCKFGLCLDNVQAEVMSFNDGSLLNTQVLTALNKQFGV